MKRRSFFKNATVTAALTTAGFIPSLFSTNPKEGQNLEGKPYHYTKSLENARQMPGFLLNFIVTKEQTGGAYSILEGFAKKGGEPPLHVHEFEDEAFFMLDGEMIVTIGEEDFHVKPGDYIFLPRQIPHTQKFITDEVHVMLYISPAGLEEFFRAVTQPATNFEIPPVSTEVPSEEVMKQMIALNKKFGISSPK